MSRDQLPEGAEMSDRGFVHMPAVPSVDGGAVGFVRTYESSSADQPCLWVEVGEDGQSSTALITLTDACELRDQLTWLIENHYQLGADEEPVPVPPKSEAKTWVWDGSGGMATEIIDWGLQHGFTISFSCESEQDCHEDRHVLKVGRDSQTVVIPRGIEFTLTDLTPLQREGI